MIFYIMIPGIEIITSLRDDRLTRDEEIACLNKKSVAMNFEKGQLTAVNGNTYGHSVEAIQALQELAAPYGIRRDIHAGDTITGIKGRVGFEAAAQLRIRKAYHALEKHVLTKWRFN